jgi:lipopolysaccharide cholinephosphotransferase
MNEIQNVQRQLLKEFIAICEKHGLRYYLFGGSCLGAIRHQGFIPWDDDLDIAMPRPDFNRLIALTKEFKEPFFLQSVYSDNRYSYPYAKLRNSDTCFKEAVFAFTNMNHGIWIDIFPLDGMSKKPNATNVKSIKPYFLWFRWYFSYLSAMLHKPRFDKHFFLDIITNLISIIFFPFGILNWNSKSISKSIQKIPYEEASLVGPYLTMYFNREALPSSVFGEGVIAKFEGLEVKVPADYHRYLTHIFGDYMKLPPKEKQMGHHYHVGVSATTSYRDYK